MNREDAIALGKIILLNGASSSGKSTIARLLQNKIDEPFWHISIDHLRDGGVLPLDRIRSGEFWWADMRVAFFEGFHRSLPSYALAGNNIIIEHVIESREWMRLLVELFAPFDVFFVGIHCPLEELVRREVARGDRRVGDASTDFESVHSHAIYDLELDSTIDPGRNVDELVSTWYRRIAPSAFDKLAHR